MDQDEIYTEIGHRVEASDQTGTRKIFLSYSKLSSLVRPFGQVATLQKLYIQADELLVLSEWVGPLGQLRELHIESNKLASLPEWVGQLVLLHRLNLGNNQLTSLPDWIGQLRQLRVLEIQRNELTALPVSIGSLRKVRLINLSFNRLTSLPDAFSRLTGMKALGLGENLLKTLPVSLAHCKGIEELFVWGNQLTTLPDWLGNLTQLKILDARDNQLATLPATLLGLERLDLLFLDGNPSLGIPPEILRDAHYPKSILDYYFRPKRPLNEAKLILVGFGEVGKTSLVNRLVHGAFDTKEQKTDGINITQWPVELPDGGDRALLHVWDFGGQEIMHSTHQFFLSHRSVYLLVLNGRGGHEEADAEYWLNLIRSFGGESPVIVVLNKQREHPFDLNRNNLLSKFPGMIRDFIRTECGEESPEGLEELRARILAETDALPGLRDGFPEQWFAIKDELATMEDNYLTFEAYRDLCAKHGEKAQMDQDQLAVYLHQLGVALNYKDDSRLRDMHVLNPHWVTEGIYKILNAPLLEAQKGELHIDCLCEILDRKDYPRERHPFLLNLMRKFHLCFEFPDQAGHFLVPDLAEKDQPAAASAFDPKECLNFHYKYPSLHEGVLPNFITRTYILSENQARWRTGVILAFEGCRALVKADLTDRVVSVSVTGDSPEGRRRLLAVIRADFEQIHRSFKFKPEEQVPVPGHPEIVISYNELLILDRNGVKFKQQVIGEKVVELNVLDLLNGVDVEGARRSRDGEREAVSKGVKVFYSYSHKDEVLREELETHLKILQRQGLISGWHDRRIVGGEEWGPEIDRNLEEADIILLLVSADFVASDYCYDIELKRAMERHEAGDARVVPIFLREANWKGAPFAKLQGWPKDANPVVAHERNDIAWAEISTALGALARELGNVR